ncbi:PaaI family thioesterase [Engelhardtia mirabilis]|uniref:Medium/long-chain acyl-CoA thioesterase YigI n=1 Tax=Engelhardtia mirabilis TaxID=2528011 RepID=A0A518BJG0_9BACT|nr:hypothetical protein Pla133_21920 [Planctomycetes bacterium Pla133]QDV01441.1 hypothetical protein Pla86_21920 [Planctomycetes bacterium Pla86]
MSPDPAPLSSFNQHLGFEVEDREDGTSLVRLPEGHNLRNELGVVHGGVAMALLDSAMGRTAVRSLEPGARAATVQFSVQFLAPAEGRLTASARVARAGRSIAFMEGECIRDDGVVVARAHGTWAVRRPESA